MSCPKKSTNLATALRLAYPGPSKIKRLAQDTGYSESAAKLLLSGFIPAQWARLIDLIAKKPEILTRAFQTTWAEELQARIEIRATRRRLDEMERRLEKTSPDYRAVAEPPRGVVPPKVRRA